MLKQRIGANFKNAESAKINGGLSIFFEKFYTLGSVYPGTNFKEKLSMGSEHTDYTLNVFKMRPEMICFMFYWTNIILCEHAVTFQYSINLVF